jgi:hypothetical protein
MLEDALDPRAQPDGVARALAARAAEQGCDLVEIARWLSGWHDQEGSWTNLRNLEHWIERAG